MAATVEGPLMKEPRTFARSRRRDIAEIAIAYGLILTVIWTPRPLQQMLWWAAVAVIAAIMAVSFDGLRTMGLRTSNFFGSFWVVGAALAISAAAVLIAARLHTLRQPENTRLLIEAFWLYAIWSGVQQFLLQCFFLSRLLRLLPGPRQAAFTAALLFAIAHLPNPILSILTIIWGTLACLIFLRYRNLYPLAIAHAILGITIAVSVPGHVDHNMRVGLGYLKYHRRQRLLPLPVQRSQSDQMASTVAWVTADAPTLRRHRHARP
ncbi:MAG TPA: CPBP family intramembrane glutamic endopeptidase [Terracidiphilus sp.]|nr:CPBP family intramembrane glutamic endopeptidase [Terracidiphilus sp.]